jgi:hypothetical protein
MRERWLWALLPGLALGCADAGPDRLVLRAVDAETRAPIACRFTLQPAHPGRLPLWGYYDMVGEWLDAHSFAIEHSVFAEYGEAAVSLPPDDYRILASAGLEYAITELWLAEGAEDSELEVALTRVIDSRGWACADLHVHSAPSVDSLVPLDQRLVNAVAEGLDAIAPTDHNVVGPWALALAQTGFQGRLALLLGTEITPDFWTEPMWAGHFGVYPVAEDADPLLLEQPWPSPIELVAGIRRAYPDAWLQVNHPRINGFIGYLDAIGFDPALHAAEPVFRDLDSIEVWNAHEFDLGMGTPPEEVLRDFFAVLATGRRFVATGATDTHQQSRQPLGYPRTCVRVDDDRPGQLSGEMLLDGLRQGAAFVTSGPWLEVSIDGHGPGDGVALVHAQAAGLQVAVDGPDWAAVNRALVFVDGKVQHVLKVDDWPFAAHLPLELRPGSYVVVLVSGDQPIGPIGGAPIEPLPTLAFSNPIYVE